MHGPRGASSGAGIGRVLPVAMLLLVATTLALSAGVALPAGPLADEVPLSCPETKNICLQAERQGRFDLKSGTAVLEGNVRGFLRAEGVRFSCQKLEAFRDAEGLWARLLLSRQVTLTQGLRHVTADHGVVEQTTFELTGNVHMKEPGVLATAEEVLLERQTSRATLRGAPSRPAFMSYTSTAPETAPQPPAPGTAAPAPPAPDLLPPATETTEVRAQQAVMDRDAGRVNLTGQVAVRRLERAWSLFAENVELALSEQNELTGFRAEGGVRIEQPDRLARADTAFSQNNNETILLVGNASVQQPGQFDLTSERIEIYTDAEKGIVRSDDRQKPLQLALNLGKATTYRLDADRLAELERRGLPRVTATKLNPLRGRTFDTKAAFSTEVKKRLTPREAERFLELITAQAKGTPQP